MNPFAQFLSCYCIEDCEQAEVGLSSVAAKAGHLRAKALPMIDDVLLQLQQKLVKFLISREFLKK